MTLFNAGGELYAYPDTWHDVKAAKYLDYLRDIEPDFPKEITDLYAATSDMEAIEPDILKWEKKTETHRDEIMELITDGRAPKKCALVYPELHQKYTKARDVLDNIESKTDGVWRAKVYYPYLARMVSHFTEIPYSVCTSSMNLGSLEFLASRLNAVFNSVPEDEQKSVYRIGSQVYELPDQLMKKSTLIEFAEAAQFEQDMQAMKNGNALAMLDVASVLLRPPDAPYSEEQYELNRATFTEHMTMYDLYQIGFFLRGLSTRYGLAFLNYTLEGGKQPGIGI